MLFRHIHSSVELIDIQMSNEHLDNLCFAIHEEKYLNAVFHCINFPTEIFILIILLPFMNKKLRTYRLE